MTFPLDHTKTPRVRFEDVAVGARFFVGVQPYLKTGATEYVGYQPDTWPNDFHRADDLVTFTAPTPAERIEGFDRARAAFSASATGQWCNKHREWTDSKGEARCSVCIEEEATAVREAAIAVLLTAAEEFVAKCRSAAIDCDVCRPFKAAIAELRK